MNNKLTKIYNGLVRDPMQDVKGYAHAFGEMMKLEIKDATKESRPTKEKVLLSATVIPASVVVYGGVCAIGATLDATKTAIENGVKLAKGTYNGSLTDYIIKREKEIATAKKTAKSIAKTEQKLNDEKGAWLL